MKCWVRNSTKVQNCEKRLVQSQNPLAAQTVTCVMWNQLLRTVCTETLSNEPGWNVVFSDEPPGARRRLWLLSAPQSELCADSLRPAVWGLHRSGQELLQDRWAQGAGRTGLGPQKWTWPFLVMAAHYDYLYNMWKHMTYGGYVCTLCDFKTLNKVQQPTGINAWSTFDSSTPNTQRERREFH